MCVCRGVFHVACKCIIHADEYNPLTDTCIKAFVRLLTEMPAEAGPSGI